ncbi:hypothetical protein [Sporosarcina sp. BP05]|uniref:hypothetical protein n=1 Tax=Sporosarcina sp. BP05 TaxID=2758726 RepID=UPI00164661B2|nr:hypothetical protein [Sporosarcina sp. BP05]
MDAIIKFYKWLIDTTEVQGWAEVSEREINIYLLNFPVSSREITKRLLFNFFEYAKKQRFIFNNPIEQFVSRDRMMEVKPLSKREHAKIYRKLTTDINELFVEKLICSLIYFHGLTSKQLVEIKFDNIKLGGNCIFVHLIQ